MELGLSDFMDSGGWVPQWGAHLVPSTNERLCSGSTSNGLEVI